MKIVRLNSPATCKAYDLGVTAYLAGYCAALNDMQVEFEFEPECDVVFRVATVVEENMRAVLCPEEEKSED